MRSSPAIADLDGDGEIEVVIGSFDQKVYCLRGSDGAQRWVFTTGYWVWSSPAVADVDEDGTMDVLIGSCDDKFYCLRGSDGTQKWAFTTGNDVWSSPAVADVDEDGAEEVLIGSFDRKVYCLRGSDGTQKWAISFPSDVHTPGTLADFDGDSKFELLVSQCANYPTSPDTLYCLNAENGTIAWKISLAWDVHSPFAGDIDGDGCIEIITGTANTNAQGYHLSAIDDPYNATGCGSLYEGIEEGLGEGFDFRPQGRGIYLFLSRDAQISLTIYDASGKLVQRLYDGVLSRGGYTFIPRHEGPEITRGVYLVVLRYAGGIRTLKIIR